MQRLPWLAWFALGWLLLLGGLPVARLLGEAVQPAALSAVLADTGAWRAAGRSLLVASLSAALAAVIGGALAHALLLRALPGRRGLIFLSTLPLLVPPQVMALAFAQAGGPASPLLLALGLAPPLGTPNPLYGLGGMVLLLGIQGAPLVLLGVASLVRRLPGEAFMAGEGLGAPPAMVLRRLAWPLLWPGLASGAALAFLAALGNFGIAALLGIPGRYVVLPVLIWQRLAGAGVAGLSQAAALSILLALMALPALWLQGRLARRASLPEGRAFRPMPLPRPVALGGVALIGLYLLLVLGLPLLSLLTTAAVPALGVEPSLATLTARHFLAALAPGAQTLTAFAHSLMLSLACALLLALVAMPIALLARARPVRWALGVADLPNALPGACTGVAAILVVLTLPGLGALYGTLWLIGLAYLSRFQALAMRPVGVAAARLDPRLDAAAASLGAGWWRRLRVVHVPALMPAAMTGGILVVLLAVNEVTISSLLYGPGQQTLGVLVFNLQDSGQAPLAAAVSCLSLLLVAALMALASLMAGRLPPGTLPWRP